MRTCATRRARALVEAGGVPRGWSRRYGCTACGAAEAVIDALLADACWSNGRNSELCIIAFRQRTITEADSGG